MNNFALMTDAQRSKHGWPRIGRQFYDVWALLDQDEVRAFLPDRPLVSEVLADCYRVSEAFAADCPPPDGGFALSPIFTASGSLASALSTEHDRAIRDLYYGANGPSFQEVLDRVRENSGLLNVS